MQFGRLSVVYVWFPACTISSDLLCLFISINEMSNYSRILLPAEMARTYKTQIMKYGATSTAATQTFNIYYYKILTLKGRDSFNDERGAPA